MQVNTANTLLFTFSLSLVDSTHQPFWIWLGDYYWQMSVSLPRETSLYSAPSYLRFKSLKYGPVGKSIFKQFISLQTCSECSLLTLFWISDLKAFLVTKISNAVTDPQGDYILNLSQWLKAMEKNDRAMYVCRGCIVTQDF